MPWATPKCPGRWRRFRSGARTTWDAVSLDAWLKNPEALVPGQRMGYSVPDATDRDDLVAFLRRAATR